METFMLTTKFPKSLKDFESAELIFMAKGVSAYYNIAAPSFKILSSYKTGEDTLIDFAHASNRDEAEKAAKAIAKATGTKIEVTQVVHFRDYLTKLLPERPN